MSTFQREEKKIDDAMSALHRAALFLDDTGDFESDALDEAHRMTVKAIRLLEQVKKDQAA